MSSKTSISIDAMGGSNAPDAIIEAIYKFLSFRDNVFFKIYGQKSVILPKVTRYKLSKGKYELIDCKEVISDEDSAINAWRNSKNSSMRKAIEAVKDNQAQSMVSCGNTGALMLTAKMLLGTLEHVKRPAIAGIFPSLNNNGTVMLDIGANLECKESHLFHFALMGACFAKILLQKENPKISILNVGSEKNKGRALEQETYKILQKSELNFIGFIEGHDVVQGKTDVLVTDGFSGNIFLKASEGAADICIDLMKKSITKGGIIARLAGLVLKSSIKSSFKIIDPNCNNGAMLMGLKGIVIKSHGSANVNGIFQAINKAYQLAKYDINTKISKELIFFEEKGIYLGLVDKISKFLHLDSKK